MATVSWKGYTWDLRNGGSGSPGFGGWSDSNVTGPDGSDYLTLKITNAGSSPVGSEIRNQKLGMGYGTYILVVGTRLDTLDKNIVLGGMFPYFEPTAVHRQFIEFDTGEISQWDAIYPAVILAHNVWYGNDAASPTLKMDYVDMPTDTVTTYRLIWEKGKATFDTFSGAGVTGTNLFHTVVDHNVPDPSQEQLIINLWTYASGAPDATDTDAPATDIVLRDFSFTPFGSEDTDSQGHLLLETNDKVLLETNDKMEIEDAPFKLVSSTNFADGDSTTAQLTAPSGKTSGSDFQAGKMGESSNPVAAIDLGSGKYTEVEWNLKATTGARVGDIYEFRVTRNGVEIPTYTVTPEWTIASDSTTTTQTITGKSRIQKSVSQTIQGRARIRTTVSQTIQGRSRIRQTVTQTITGKARVQSTTTQTITGRARIQKSVTQTITGKSRVRVSVSQTITGTGNIRNSTTRTITAKSAIRNTTTKTITGTSRVQKQVSQTITGKTRVTARVSQTITGKARIAFVTARNITTGGDNVDANSFTTASVSPVANKLYLLWVFSTCATAANTPTVSGAGMTWTEVDHIDTAGDGTGVRKITLFRSLNASPGSGALTIAFGGQTQTGVAWSLMELSGINIGGTNGANAVVQYDKENSAASVSSLTSTLGAFGNTRNATVGGFGHPLNTAATPGSPFVTIGEQHQNNPNLGLLTQFYVANDTTVDASFTGSVPCVAITAEIRAADTTITQTITGKARITASTTRTITGRSRIQKSVSQTITGKARIKQTVSQTITGKARVTATTTKTITGKAAIRNTTAQTITGRARIQKSVSQTITAKAYVTKTELLDQKNRSGSTGIGFGDTGNGRDYMGQGFIPTGKTISSVAFHISSKDANTNIGYLIWIDAADSNFYPTGAAHVGIGGATEINNATLVTNKTTKYALASVVNLTPGQRYVIMAVPWNTSTHAKAVSYNDWISSTGNPYANGRRIHLDGSFANPSAPDSGNADILFEEWSVIPVDQTITAKSRIQKSVSQTIQGRARVQKSVSQTIQGRSRIRQTVSQTITGKAAVRNTTTRTITGKARIQKSVTQTISAKGDIRKSATQTITGRGRIRNTASQTITGKSRVRKSVTQTITGKTRVQKSVSQTITGKARITASTTRTITGRGRIQKSVSQTVTAKSRIQKSVTSTVTGKARVQNSVPVTITAKSRIQNFAVATIVAKARIQVRVTKTITGIAYIRRRTAQTYKKKPRIYTDKQGVYRKRQSVYS